MRDILNKSTWDRPYSAQSWTSMISLLGIAIIFFAGFSGPNWWVLHYDRPDAAISLDAKSFGLFKMCTRGDCSIDITDKRLINAFVPSEFKDAALYSLPACQWLMSFNVAFILILFVVYLGFLAGAETYYAEVWLQIIICILTIISIAIFGSKFRGGTDYIPFGWSYWVSMIASILFLFNAILMAFISAAVRKKDEMSPMKLYMLQEHN